jgi:hypothetical protein
MIFAFYQIDPKDLLLRADLLLKKGNMKMDVAKLPPNKFDEQKLCHKVKNPGPEDQTLVIPRGDLLY